MSRLILEGKAFNISWFRISYISHRLFRYFYQMQEVSFYSYFTEGFCDERVLNFTEWLFWIYWEDRMAFLLYFASDFLLIIANFLFKIFVFIRDISLQLSYNVLIRFCSQRYTGLIKWARKYSPFLLPVKELYKISIITSLNFQKNLTVKSVGTEVFVEGLFLITDSISLNNMRILRYYTPSCISFW